MAEWLQRSSGERVSEFAELLAYHLGTAAHLAAETGTLEADLREQALRWLRSASDAARRRLALHKAVRLAEDALALSETDLQRAESLEALGTAHFDGYAGDPAYDALVEAIDVRVGGVPEDGRAIARLAGFACELPIRWPGSMKDSLPDEPTVQALMDLGFANLPPGDGEERVRLLSLRSGWLFAFPNEHVTEPQMESFERAGIEASEIAARLGLWDLASGALDLAGASRCSVGRYGAASALHELRRAVMPQVTNPLEIGDFHSVGIWIDVELGRYQDAIRHATEALALIGGRGPNVEIHARSWFATALWLAGRWDEALEEIAAVTELLDDRRDDPPYFAMHAFGAAGMIHEARGEQAEARRLLETMAKSATSSSGRTYPSLVRLLVERGEPDRAWAVERPWNWRVHRTDALFAEAERAVASARWDLVPDLVTAMREQADLGPAPLLAPAADRLTGRAALAAGEDAIDALESATDGFDALGTPYERARTQVDFAAALRAVNRRDAASDVLASAAITFEALGAAADLERVRRLG